MSQRQLQRWHVMGLVEAGKITLKEAGEKIGVSYRQAKRIRRAVRVRGGEGSPSRQYGSCSEQQACREPEATGVELVTGALLGSQ